MPVEICFKDLGLMDYKKTWDYQEELFALMLSAVACQSDQPAKAGTLLFVEHPPVYTLGKSGSADNLLVNEAFLRSKGASFYQINRGGDITYHGPGQLVAYPIFNLGVFHLGVRDYVNKLEEVVINCLQKYGVSAGRLDGASGVWLDAAIREKSRKICAVGVRASRGITMHGFAFNVNTDLSYYNWINPCGFTDRGVTSLEKEMGHKIDFEQLKTDVKHSFEMVFGLDTYTLS